MGVSFIIDSISNSGGTDRVITTLSNALVADGKDVIIHVLKDGEPFYDLDDRVSIKYFNDSSRLMKIKKIISFEKKNKNPIIVISMGKLSVQFGIMSKVMNLKNKIICSDHVSIESFGFIKKYLKLFCYSFYTSVVTLTKHDKSYVENFFFINPSKIKTIRNISSFELTKSDLSLKNEKTVIAIGRLDYQKNFSRLISIWSKTKTHDWKLKIIGSGEELPILKDKIKNLNATSIQIIPATRDIQSFYKEASLLLMSSRYEGLPMVLIEAKNFGLPVIAFDCKTGPREIIENDGYLINYHEDEDYSTKLNLLLSNSSLRETFSRTAILNSDKYSTKVILSQWNELING